MSAAAAVKILPLYALLYAFSQLAIQRRFDTSASWETARSALRSTCFIFFHAYNGAILGCALRNGFGRFYYRVLVCAPALLSSYLSLLIEKPARRQALAFYLLNMASEIVYRMAVTKGFFKPLRHGETLLFSLSLAAWYHLLKAHGFGHDPVSGAVKVLVGRDEAKSRSRRPASMAPAASAEPQDGALAGRAGARRAPFGELAGRLQAGLGRLGALLDQLGERLLGGRHASCPHRHERTCLRYVLAPLPSRFLVGHAIQTLVGLASRPHQLWPEPGRALRRALGSGASLRFGLFLGSLVSVGRLASCLLRRCSNSNEPAWHGLVAGFLAGGSMLWAPRASLSTYMMWKAVEQHYLLAARQQRVRCFQFTIATIYSVSAATILYTFALEPRFVRPSYMKFLDRMSDHRLHQLNRMVLDVFGTGSSVGYEDYFPDLDPKYMSNQFKELVFNWMIQPYE